MDDGSIQISDPLPQEILFEVFLRLPVNSLRKFRGVSTLWRSIIDDPHFVSSHFARSSAHPKLLIYMEDRHETTLLPKGQFFFSIDYLTHLWDFHQVANYHGRINTTGYSVSQSHGLICIDTDETIQLCNPTTGESIDFSKPSTRSTLSFLGYDPVEKKHKIINSVSSNKNELGSLIHILTLGEKDWRKVDPGIACLRVVESLSVDGIMHMIGNTRDWDKAYVMLFDVRLESFQVIPFPAELKYDGLKCLVEFAGGIGLLDYSSLFFGDMNGEIKLWLLVDIDKQVWSCTSFTFPPHHYVAGVTPAGEVVLGPIGTTGLAYLYLYSIADGHMRKVEIAGLSEQALPCRIKTVPRVLYHVESLQSFRDFALD